MQKLVSAGRNEVERCVDYQLTYFLLVSGFE